MTATGIQKTEISLTMCTYNNNGELTCIICDSVVRSEAIWTVHINSKKHRILKNAPEPKVPVDFFDLGNKSTSQISSGNKSAPLITENQTKEAESEDSDSEGSDEGKKATPEQAGKLLNPQEETLPEGFFDDPLTIDQNARNVEYKDPIEEEWEKFQKEMKEENSLSAQIIAEDQEEATAERQIDEIDEQMRNWTRVLDLELKKEAVVKAVGSRNNAGDDDDEGSSADETEFDEFLDWRSKKSYK
ncbi:hypothetical protein C0J52_08620 [Blattella germanica]|nr:hypothetical protein C0J52_08620 [Blattella germanica]